MHLAFSVHYEDKENVFVFKMGGTWTLFRSSSVYIFLNWYFLILHLFLTYTRVGSLGTFLTLNADLISSGNQPVSLIHQFHEPELGTTWLRAQALMKDGLSVNLAMQQSSPAVKRLLILHLISYVHLHCTIWPGSSPVTAALVPFCLYVVPFPDSSGLYLWI